MELTASQIRYLLTIQKLSLGGGVRPAQVAKSLTVSRPSVHRMINQLIKAGLVTKKDDTSIMISENFSVLADRYTSVFSSVSAFLTEKLNIPPDTAEEGALSILSSLNASALESVCMNTSEGAP